MELKNIWLRWNWHCVAWKLEIFKKWTKVQEIVRCYIELFNKLIHGSKFVLQVVDGMAICHNIVANGNNLSSLTKHKRSPQQRGKFMRLIVVHEILIYFNWSWKIKLAIAQHSWSWVALHCWLWLALHSWLRVVLHSWSWVSIRLWSGKPIFFSKTAMYTLFLKYDHPINKISVEIDKKKINWKILVNIKNAKSLY